MALPYIWTEFQNISFQRPVFFVIIIAFGGDGDIKSHWWPEKPEKLMVSMLDGVDMSG